MLSRLLEFSVRQRVFVLLATVVMVGIGLWIRLGILETPVFQKVLDEKLEEGETNQTDAVVEDLLGHVWELSALKAKGYDYRFVFSKESRHCDGNVFEQTLADTLVWMWRGYEAK